MFERENTPHIVKDSVGFGQKNMWSTLLFLLCTLNRFALHDKRHSTEGKHGYSDTLVYVVVQFRTESYTSKIWLQRAQGTPTCVHMEATHNHVRGVFDCRHSPDIHRTGTPGKTSCTHTDHTHEVKDTYIVTLWRTASNMQRLNCIAKQARNNFSP